ncbi:MAG TPA: zinc ribbon domain-containing protein [Limnobacter sp.]|nr:zinc ribbon domain-containing protein [Limnobacter sp.]
MSKSLRDSEKWFRRGLWLVAFLFAWFLIGLGGAIVGDLPKVEERPLLESFIEPVALRTVKEELRQAELNKREVADELEQMRLKHNAAQSDTESEKEKFMAWVATRQATDRPEQDQELIARTQTVESLEARERVALAQLEVQQKRLLDAEQAERAAQRKLANLEEGAQSEFDAAVNAQELRVFVYRLMLTLPLLLAAAWAYKHKRKSQYWPFVWGFIWFAVFAFFVELLPYLPSYGGYVHYFVGIALTVLVGRQAIVGLNRYLEKQRLAEARPEHERRKVLDYDVATARLAKGICPGCERKIDTKNTSLDFCPHCGIGLHDHCTNCNIRKSTFARFCHACGSAAAKRAGGHDEAAPGVTGRP